MKHTPRKDNVHFRDVPNTSPHTAGLRATTALFVFLVVAAIGGCLVQRVAVEELDPEAPRLLIQSSVKVHLTDGSVAILPNGFTVDGDSLWATGISSLYNSELVSVPFSGRLPIDQILALESFDQNVDEVGTLFMSVVGTAAVAVGSAFLMVAIFGSCPTVYAMEPEGPVLQSEGFSYSIAPAFEIMDHDRIDVAPNDRGVIELELRNEALETHYINQVELLEVAHAAGQTAYPIGEGKVTVVEKERAPVKARDLSGRNVTEAISSTDERAYATPESRMDELSKDDLTDSIELSWPVVRGAKTALVFRGRNSLLNTIFLYDVMLADQGAKSLDWLSKELDSEGKAVELSTFYQKHMGVRVSVMGPDGYELVGRLGDVGPIAWEDMAIELPVLQEDSIRVRLEFLADNWRIDRVALADIVSTELPIHIPVARVTGSTETIFPEVTDRLSEPDDSYLVTGPGTRYKLEFDSALQPEIPRTYMLAIQGYYTEWVRGTWIRANPEPKTFALDETTLMEVIRQWRAKKEPYEQQFYATKIPVR